MEQQARKPGVLLSSLFPLKSEIKLFASIGQFILSLSLSFNTRLENYKRAIAPPLIIALAHSQFVYSKKAVRVSMGCVIDLWAGLVSLLLQHLPSFFFSRAAKRFRDCNPERAITGRVRAVVFQQTGYIRVRPNRFQPRVVLLIETVWSPRGCARHALVNHRRS